jgi:DNA-binding CsgD family transcriptional regulator
MKNDIKPLVKLWKEEISIHIQQYAPYDMSPHLYQMAELFSPGLFYYYILNFQNLKMDYVHPGTRDVLGLEPENVTVEKILEMLLPEEMIEIGKKEVLVVDFHTNYLNPAQIPFYKFVYFIRLTDMAGNIRTILHQATTLKVSDTGKVEHVLGVHTDVSHLNFIKNNKVSIISLNGGLSYYNLDPEAGFFDPSNSGRKGPHSVLFTKRELEIVKLFAKGYTAVHVAEELHIAENTVRTHRKQILEKTDCTNMTELVACCIIEGVI